MRRTRCRRHRRAQALDDAELELERFVEATPALELGVDLFQKGIAQRTAARDAARKVLREATPAAARSDSELPQAFYAQGLKGEPILDLLQAMTPHMRTWLLGQVIKRVEVRRSSGPVEAASRSSPGDEVAEWHRLGEGRPPIAA